MAITMIGLIIIRSENKKRHKENVCVRERESEREGERAREKEKDRERDKMVTYTAVSHPGCPSM